MSRIMKGPTIGQVEPIERPKGAVKRCRFDPDTGELLETQIIKPGKFTNPPKLVLPKTPHETMSTESESLKKGKGLRVVADVTGFACKPGDKFAVLTISLGKDPIQHFSIKVPYQAGMDLTSRPIDLIITPTQ